MVDFFDRLYNSIKNKNQFLSKIRFYSILRFTIRLISNIILPIHFCITERNKNYRLKNYKKTYGRTIVSFTSFPARINRVWLVVETLLRQTQKPDKIILWLSVKQFSSLDLLPKRLLKQINRGLEIRLTDGDIQSHKKYYYALLEFSNDYILIVDDDIFYRSTMIEDLISYSFRFSKAIIAQYCKKMRWNRGKIEPYNTWEAIKKETTPNMITFFGSGGGTLLPPFSLDEDALKESLFMNLAPSADDVWLNAMCRLKRTKVVTTDYHTQLLPVLHSSNSNLASINIGLNQNDIQIREISRFYIESRGIDPFREIEQQ